MGPQLEDKCLTEHAVVWPIDERPGRYGDARVGPRVQIRARWELDLSLVPDVLARNEGATGIVDVQCKLDIGTIMWRGKLKDVPLDKIRELYRVVGFSTIPDIKGIATKFTAIVAPHSEELPGAA